MKPCLYVVGFISSDGTRLVVCLRVSATKIVCYSASSSSCGVAVSGMCQTCRLSSWIIKRYFSSVGFRVLLIVAFVVLPPSLILSTVLQTVLISAPNNPPNPHHFAPLPGTQVKVGNHLLEVEHAIKQGGKHFDKNAPPQLRQATQKHTGSR